MKERCKLTIIMALYNKEKYLSKAIDSILMQKVDFDYTIMIIDDMSTDNSLKIAQEYAEKYSQIQILQNTQKLYYYGTVLRAYGLLKTKYLTLLDPDDYWLSEDHLQQAIDYLDVHKNTMVYMSNSYIENNDNVRTPYINATSREITTVEEYLPGHTSATIYRNFITPEILKILDKVSGTEDMKYLDGETFRTMFALTKGSIHYEDRITSVYQYTQEGIWSHLSDQQHRWLNIFIFSKMYYLMKKLSVDKQFLLSLVHGALYYYVHNIDFINQVSLDATMKKDNANAIKMFLKYEEYLNPEYINLLPKNNSFIVKCIKKLIKIMRNIYG